MASITLTGTLLDPTGEVAVGDQIRFTHRTTTGETIQFARSVLIIPPNGLYNITLEFGLIFVEYLDIKDVNYKSLGVVTVNQDSTATDLPGLLNAIVPPTDAQLLLFQGILADTEDARDIALLAAAQQTTLELIASTTTHPNSTVLTLSGHTLPGDGGGGKWQLNGVVGQTPSQSPTQLADFLLNDGNGNQWALVDGVVLAFNAVQYLPLPFGATGNGNYAYNDNGFDKITDPDRLNPATLAIAISDASLKVGDILNVQERTTGNGGGAIWKVVLKSTVTISTGAPDNGNIVASTGDLTLALVLRIGSVVVIDKMGAKPDGTDQTAAVQAALDLGLPTRIPTGEFRALKVIMQEDQRLFGDGWDSVLLTLADDDAVIMQSFCTVENFAIRPAVTNASFAHPDDDFTDVEKDFNYRSSVKGIGLDTADRVHITIHKMFISQLDRGISLGNCRFVNVTENLIKQIGGFMTQFFNVQWLTCDDNIAVYGGGSGGIAASSVKDATFTGNIVISSGTGINTGGSNDPLFNAERVTVAGNAVLARDCIVLENGIEHATVTGNVCRIFENKDLPGTTGVGVACTSDSAGGSAGLVSHVTITGNSMVAFSRNVAFGVKIGSSAVDYTEKFDGIVVADNEIIGANFAIFAGLSAVGLTINNLTITGNVAQGCTKGILINRVEDGRVSLNVMEQGGEEPLSGQFGLEMNVCNRIRATENTLKGFGVSVDLDVDCLQIELEDNLTSPHRVSATSGLDIVSATVSFFNPREIAISDTGDRLIVNSTFIFYVPASTHTIVGLLSGVVPSGKVISVKFNGNTTMQNGASIVLNSGTVTPPLDGIITFASNRVGRLHEISRSF